MPRHRRMQVIQQMLDQRVIPVFNTPDLPRARDLVRACHSGGALVIEFTNRGDFALEIFAELERTCRAEMPAVMLGVGSIVDAPTAALAIAAGANFIVGPGFDEATARLCNRRKIPYLPGCASVTEIGRAEEHGCEIVKIFPGGQVGGPAFIKAVLGPCPWSSMMPTGGVEPTRESLAGWLGAGAVCVGIGSQLIDASSAPDPAALAQRVRETLTLAREVAPAKRSTPF